MIGKPTPDRLHVHQGQSISMRCAVIGNPEPKILWFKDGAVILEEDNGQKQVDSSSAFFRFQHVH